MLVEAKFKSVSIKQLIQLYFCHLLITTYSKALNLSLQTLSLNFDLNIKNN
jgi:hypothetical protein